MKKITLLGIIALIIPFASADYGNMMGYGMMGYSNPWFGLFGVIWFVLIAFVFSWIFWYTYKTIVLKNSKKGERK
jgi:hypothetical protein